MKQKIIMDWTETKLKKAYQAKNIRDWFLSCWDIFGTGLKTLDELIGVDIGSTSIKICLLKKTKNGYQIGAITKKDYEENLLSDGNIIDPAFIAQELTKIVAENNIVCKDAASALSSYTIITKKVALPFLEEEELENSIKLEVEAIVPFPLKDVYYSYYILGVDEEKEDMMDVQIVAVKKEIVDGYITVFRLSGLNLHLLDVDIFGVANIVERLDNQPEFSVVAADIGGSVSNIAIIKGESLEFTREVLLGGKYLTTQIEKSTGLKYVEAEKKKIMADNDITYLFEDFIFNISSEIVKTINFYTATKPNSIIGKIYLTGGSSILPGLKEKIEEDTRLEVVRINPFLFLAGDNAMFHIHESLNTFMTVALYLSSRVVDIRQ